LESVSWFRHKATPNLTGSDHAAGVDSRFLPETLASCFRSLPVRLPLFCRSPRFPNSQRPADRNVSTRPSLDVRSSKMNRFPAPALPL
jgi:hypothetical protein